MHKCESCGKECKNKRGLQMHQKTHQQVSVAAVPTKVISTPAPHVEQYNTEKYKELPQPIIDHLKITFGNWLNYFEIGQEWKEDFGGYGIYIKVPEHFSAGWQRVDAPVYDDAQMKMVAMKKLVVPDIRWKPLRDMADAKGWINLVKKHVIDTAYQKGIRLPSTNTGLDETRQTKEQYEAAIAGSKS